MSNPFASQFNLSTVYLKRFALKLTKDQSDANDLYQETAYQAFKNRNRFKNGTNMKAWLSTIMRNIFINNFRRKKRILESKEANKNAESHFFGNGTVSNGGEQSVNYTELISLVHALDRNYKEPFLLAYQGYSYEEISKLTGNVPVGTIKSRIHLARKKLKEQISKLYN